MKMLEVEVLIKTLSILVPTPRSIFSVPVEYVPGIKLNKPKTWILVISTFLYKLWVFFVPKKYYSEEYRFKNNILSS